MPVARLQPGMGARQLPALLLYGGHRNCHARGNETDPGFGGGGVPASVVGPGGGRDDLCVLGGAVGGEWLSPHLRTFVQVMVLICHLMATR